MYLYLTIDQTNCDKKKVLYHVSSPLFLLSSISSLFGYVEQSSGRDEMEEQRKS